MGLPLFGGKISDEYALAFNCITLAILALVERLIVRHEERHGPQNSSPRKALPAYIYYPALVACFSLAAVIMTTFLGAAVKALH
ncbi:hypothetical protein KRX56_01695 [Dermabacteraceae bacterium TAE3-ERU27]|nr:hypothetical protein [Dermabacteraceae bacterium TAE3-ERU27]